MKTGPIFTGNTLHNLRSMGERGGFGNPQLMGNWSFYENTVEFSAKYLLENEREFLEDLAGPWLLQTHPGVRRDISHILAACVSFRCTVSETSYILATAYHESLLGRYMVELDDGEKYEGRPDLGNTEEGDGPLFKGRGYVQITGRTNYEKAAGRTGLPLVADPELTEQPWLAAYLLVRGMVYGEYTGKRLYIRRAADASFEDYREQRPVVNGRDQAPRISKRAMRFQEILVQRTAYVL